MAQAQTNNVILLLSSAWPSHPPPADDTSLAPSVRLEPTNKQVLNPGNDVKKLFPLIDCSFPVSAFITTTFSCSYLSQSIPLVGTHSLSISWCRWALCYVRFPQRADDL